MRALPLRRLPPLDAMIRALDPSGRVWLDGEPGHPEGRWTFLASEPAETRVASFAEDPWAPFDGIEGTPGAIEGAPLDHAMLPWWIGYVAYDAAWSEARRLGLRAPMRHTRGAQPVVCLSRYEALVAIDHVAGAGWVVGSDPRALETLRDRLEAASEVESRAVVGAATVPAASAHRGAIERALAAIAAGEIYQVNLARRWTAPYEGSPLVLWRAMRAASPVPLGMYLERPGHAVLGRTMERFLRWDREDRRLWTSPIKGTIARSGSDDAAEAARLSSDDKERAEHAMIVDLMRNDLSRVATTGSVKVRAPLRVEPFAGLSHLVSTVECETREDVGLREILEATFPPGSITGTPKLRAMELIEREEPCARGVYTGALGYIDRAGGLSLAVAIRTAVIADDIATYFAGGGLVSASDPDREIAETELKAKVFLEALNRVREENLD